MENALFRRFQRPLLALVNNKWGRIYLDLNQPLFKYLKALEIGPSHVVFEDGKFLRGKFMVGQPVFEKKLYRALTIGEVVAGISAESLLRYFGLSGGLALPLVGLTNYTVGAGDGWVARDTGTETWAQARDTADGSAADIAGTTDNIPNSTFTGGVRYYNYRAFWPADTSAIGAPSSVTAATLNLYVNSVSNADTTSIDLVATSQASTSTLAVGDYDAYVNTSIGNKTIASMSMSAFNAITVTDLTKISKTVFTKIGGITNRDLANAAPTGDNHININNSDNGSNKPYYGITWTPAGAAFFFDL